jgi:LacI family transcriptional regulator
MNYQPDILAQSFKKRKSFLIGVLGYDVNASIFSDLLGGLQEAMFPHNYAPMFLAHKNAEEESSNINRCLKRQVDGFIVNTDVENAGHNNVEQYTELKEAGVPIIELLGVGLKDVPTVNPDYFTAGYEAAKYLIKQGHRHIAHVTHELYSRHLENTGQCFDAWRRYSGYKKAIEEAGLKERVITHPPPSSENLYPASWFAHAESATNQILESSEKITALICYIDYQAFGIINKLKARGIKVPEDVAVIGYRNLPVSEFEVPHITTQDLNAKELGKTAADMIIRQLDNKPVEHHLISCPLIIKQSTDIRLKH